MGIGIWAQIDGGHFAWATYWQSLSSSSFLAGPIENSDVKCSISSGSEHLVNSSWPHSCELATDRSRAGNRRPETGAQHRMDVEERGWETNKQTNRNIEIVLELKAKRQSETLGQDQEQEQQRREQELQEQLQQSCKCASGVIKLNVSEIGIS